MRKSQALAAAIALSIAALATGVRAAREQRISEETCSSVPLAGEEGCAVVARGLVAVADVGVATTDS